MTGVPEKLYFGQWQYKRKKLSSQCNLTAQIEQVQDKTSKHLNLTRNQCSKYLTW
jgi:hypothetical protein